LGIWEVDLNAGIVLRTPELCRIIEIPSSNHTVTLEESYQWYADASRAIVREAFEATVAHGTPYDLELEVVTGRGKRLWIREVCRAATRRGRPARLVGVTQDITERRQLAELVATAANRERAAIGADLHDGLGQDLTGLALLLRSAAKRAAIDGPGLVQELGELATLASNAVETARAMAHGMLPVGIGDRGFAGAIQRLARSTRTTFGVEVSIRFRGGEDRLPDGTAAEHLYRIAQEAVTNAVKHGHPRRISLVVDTRDTNTVLTVSNDGRRIDPNRATDGMGLQIMRYRARMLGGLVQIEPLPKRGIRVRCVVPQS
jgi:signal transduction histidine kinase